MVAASLEMTSEHALAKAILKRAKQDGITYSRPADFQSFPGKGVKARLNGEWGYIGNPAFFADQNLSIDCYMNTLQRLEEEGKTTILIQHEAVKGIISLADTRRKEAPACIAELSKQGIQHIALISGDSERVVQSVANSTGIDEYHARMLPEEKVEILHSLIKKYGKVAMVGDGVNDAPALAASTVGIAMGVAGSDTALETADVALMSDDLLKLPFLMHLARKTLSTIKTNIGFSILVKAAFIALVFAGMANLWMAVASDMGTSLLVIFNGMRLLRVKDGA
jgi:Cd2+/Zn2+-exporting ATPase